MNKYLFLLSLILGCVYVRAVPTLVDGAGEINELGDYYDDEAESMEDSESEEINDEMLEDMQSTNIQAINPSKRILFQHKIQFYYLNNAAVFHGDTVGFQRLYNKNNWLGCPDYKCNRKPCPRLYMEGSDWTTCWGEVFQIYRKSGPGALRVGDIVGIYYPREGNWLSLNLGFGHKHPCPGHPSHAHGFSGPEKWTKCWGEVFEIYARGKGMGATISSHDHVTIFYRQDRKWVGLVGDHHVDLRTCPGSVCPPPDHIYDKCWGEIFELWKRPTH